MKTIYNTGHVRLAVALATLLVVSAQAKIIYVDKAGLSHVAALATIQEAVAMAEDGDSIWVYPGIYAGPVDFAGKAITIQGRNGAATIDGQEHFGVIFENGEGPDSILSNVILTNSYAGVLLAGSSPKIQYITAAGNHFGITAHGGAAPDIRHSIFWNNSEADLVQCQAIYSCLANDDNLLNVHSDPLFANSAGNDYHLQSQAGRWEPTLGTWVQDARTSPCIDAGYLPEPWDQELWPHGKRVNIGAYGNTSQASMSVRGVGHLADLNLSGTVDGGDWARVAQRWKAQGPLLAEDLDRNGTIDFADLTVLSDGWLARENHQTVEFRDYWPFGVTNHWWHTDRVADAVLDWEILGHFWIGDFKVWRFHDACLNMLRRRTRCDPNEFYVYVNGGLYRTSDPCELNALPALPGTLIAPEVVALEEPFDLPPYGKVWALQGSLAEILAQYRGDPRDYSGPGLISDFQGGNHDDVLAFATESIDGLNPRAIYGRGFGPMRYSIFHLDGECYPLAILYPTEADSIAFTDIVTIQAECYQDKDRVAAVEFSDSYRTYGYQLETEVIGRDTNGQDGWSCPWPYPNRYDHTLRATALDAQGEIIGTAKEVEVTVPSDYLAQPRLTIIEPNGAPVAEDPNVITIEVEFSHPIIDGMWVEFWEERSPEDRVIGEDRDPSDGWVLHWVDHGDSVFHAIEACMKYGTREIVWSDSVYFRVETHPGRR